MAHRFRLERAARLHAPERESRQPWQPLLGLLDFERTTAVADVGAGTGYFALPIARALAGRGHVYALDIQPEILAILRERQGAIRNLHLIQTDEPGLPLRARIVDAVLLINMLHEFSDLDASLREIYRLLRPGGTLIASDWRKIPTEEGPPIEIRFTDDEARAVCERAGFGAIKFHDLYCQHFSLTARRADEFP